MTTPATATQTCPLTHGVATNPANVYGHHGSIRTCIRLYGTDTWIYDPRWEAQPKTAPPKPVQPMAAHPRTHTRTHTYITFANPNLFCDKCREGVPRFHNPEACGCQETFHNDPCGHVAAGVTSECPSWSPVDGCSCDTRPHKDRIGAA